jgi:serine phosphatase RsbU (regulator of sigma subunit)
LRISPLLGLHWATFVSDQFQIPKGAGMILLSDGVVERRHENLQDGLDRLSVELTHLGPQPAAETGSASVIDTSIHDDSTIVAIYRDQNQSDDRGVRLEASRTSRDENQRSTLPLR